MLYAHPFQQVRVGLGPIARPAGVRLKAVPVIHDPRRLQGDAARYCRPDTLLGFEGKFLSGYAYIEHEAALGLGKYSNAFVEICVLRRTLL